MKRLILVAVVAGAVLAPAIAAPGPRPDPCELQRALRAHLEHAFPGWKVLALADLTPSDKRLYAQDHPNGCPGRVSLDFFGDSTPAVAVSLTQPGKALLVLARQGTSNTWSSDVLEEGNEPGVVWMEQRGEYQDVYGERQLRVAREGLVWCGYESWAILYAWVDGKVEKIWLSD